VARLATGEAGHGEASGGRSRGTLRRTVVASTLLQVAGAPPFGELPTTSSEAAPMLVVHRRLLSLRPQQVALSAPRLLEGSVVVILISHPHLALHALLMAPPLLLNRDGAVDDVM
jgi:hypothetical protein